MSKQLTHEKLVQFLRGIIHFPDHADYDTFCTAYELTDDERHALKRMINFNWRLHEIGASNFGLENMNFKDYIRDMSILVYKIENNK